MSPDDAQLARAMIDQYKFMSLLDWFAGQALAGLTHDSAIVDQPSSKIAEWCYDMAERMVAEKRRRERDQEEKPADG